MVGSYFLSSLDRDFADAMTPKLPKKYRDSKENRQKRGRKEAEKTLNGIKRNPPADFSNWGASRLEGEEGTETPLATNLDSYFNMSRGNKEVIPFIFDPQDFKSAIGTLISPILIPTLPF